MFFLLRGFVYSSTEKIFKPVAIIRHRDDSTVESHKVSGLARTVDGTLPGLPRLELVHQPVVHLRFPRLHVLPTAGGLEFSDVLTQHLLPAPAEDFLRCVVAPDYL